MRVLAAMSGGVDSAVAAARAVDAGHDVVGVHLALAAQPGDAAAPAPAAAAPSRTPGDARRTADVLGHPVLRLGPAERFAEDVVDDFVARVRRGAHAEPVRALQREGSSSRPCSTGRSRSASTRVATGHYARVAPARTARELHRARRRGQGPVLRAGGPAAGAPRARAAPAGGRGAKDEVRAEAAAPWPGRRRQARQPRHLLRPRRRHRGVAVARHPAAPGAVVDPDGRVVGDHGGAHGFTVGQRRGLRLGEPAGDGRPRYVLDTSVADNTVTVGSAADLDVDVVAAAGVTWCGPAPRGGSRLGAQVRAHGSEVECVWSPAAHDDALRVHLEAPVRGVAAGQTLALYDGTRVVGSATVAATVPAVVPVCGPDRAEASCARGLVGARAELHRGPHEHTDLPGGGRPGAARAADGDAGCRGRAAAIGRHDVVGAGGAGVGRQRPVVVPLGVDGLLRPGAAVGGRRRHPRRRPGGGRGGRPGAREADDGSGARAARGARRARPSGPAPTRPWAR